MKIPQNKIDEVASSIDIVDVISQYTPLKKAGRSFKGRCPFHEERTPSFSVSQEKGVYHCFGCGKSGNVFTFVMEMDNVSFFDAVKALADKANIHIEFEHGEYEDRNKIELLYEINKTAAQFFFDNLMGRDGEYAREYLNQRGIKEESIRRFGIGFSLRNRDSLYNFLKDKFSTDDIITSGLILRVSTNELMDRFNGRLMFPIFKHEKYNNEFRVIAFGGRQLYENSFLKGKYVNSSNSLIYNKSKILYGLSHSQNYISQNNQAILVEGYIDFISLFQNGIHNVISSSGTSITDFQAKRLSYYTSNVLLFLDSDNAGINAGREKLPTFLRNKFRVEVVTLPKGDDPDSFIRKHGVSEINKIIERRMSILDFIEFSKKFNNPDVKYTPEYITSLIHESLKVISNIPLSTTRNLYIKDLSDKYGVYESIIRKEYSDIFSKEEKSLVKEIIDDAKADIKNNVSSQHIDKLDLFYIKLLIESSDENKKLLINNTEIEFFENPNVLQIISYAIELIEKNSKVNQLVLLNYFNEPSINSIITEALIDKNSELIINKENELHLTTKILNQYKIRKIEKEIVNIDSKLKSLNTYSENSTNLNKQKSELIQYRKKLTTQSKDS